MTDGRDMTPEMPDPPDAEVLAAEYALGLLEGEARRAFEARLAVEPSLAAAVRGWERQFARMAEAEVDEVAPPPRLKAAVQAELFGGTAAAASWWDRVAFWRGLSAATTAVAAVAVVLAVQPPRAPEGAPPPVTPPVTPPQGGIPQGTILMSHLVPIEGSGLGLALTREPGGALQVRRVAGGPSADAAQEVWLVPGGEAAPISLGLLSDAALTTLDPPPEVAALFEAGATVAISQEPPGGSPTGAPTGPILAAGQLVPL
jgi:anti-sigma-K factor RskA